MRKKIIEKLKEIELLRKTVKKLQKAGNRIRVFQKRQPSLFFHSPQLSFCRSLKPVTPDNKAFEKITAIENNLLTGLSIYKDVISYPIKYGKEKDYTGGLIDSKTHKLVEDGIHLRGPQKFSQEFTNRNINQQPGIILPEIRQISFFGGILYNHFGHFLLESLGRLWAYESVKDLDPYILFYNDMGEPGYLERSNFIYQVLAGFNIPHKKIVFIDKLCKINLVIIPKQIYGYGLCINPDIVFLKFIQSFRFLQVVPVRIKNIGKIYVSRSKVPMGRLIGEKYFEEYLQGEGYTIFHPERYSLNQQLAVYNKAEKIIFCDGAAIHACILLPALKANIAVIARRRDPRWACSDILDQFKGYKKDVLWIDYVRNQYQFGLESWQALSTVDYFEVSSSLKNNGFVDNLCNTFDSLDFPALLHAELDKHIARIMHLPAYTDFITRLKEPPEVIG